MKFNYYHAGTNYEINISVKEDGEGNKGNTMSFINMLCCFIGEARARYTELGLNALSKEADDVYKGAFKMLDDKGYYKDVNI